LIGLGACCIDAFRESPDPKSEHLDHLDKNQDGEIDFDEFIDAANNPWPMECWARSLPLSELLTDCIPSRFKNQEQTLQSIGSFTDDEITDRRCLTDIETGNIQDFHQGLVARIGTAAFSSHMIYRDEWR
jgi:hypothetical protein